MQELIDKWKESRGQFRDRNSADQLIAMATKRKRHILSAHYGTLLILTASLAGVGLFFFKRPFITFFSQVGMWMMIGGLVARIGVELISVVKYKKITLFAAVADTTKAALSFYDFRKRVHGPITISIVLIYALGFYLLSFEFNKYLTSRAALLIHFCFVIGTIALIWVIRRGIKKEIKSLLHLTQLMKELSGLQKKK